MHGFCTLLVVSAADVTKGGSMTVEIIAHCLTLVSKRAPLWTYDLRILLDNAPSANKNNTVFSFSGAISAANKVKSCVPFFSGWGTPTKTSTSSLAVSASTFGITSTGQKL